VTAVSILATLATLPSGLVSDPLSLQELGAYLREHCDTQAEKDRNRRHCLRDEIYRDGGVEFMKGVIDKVFKDPDIRALRKDWVEHTRFNNPLKRVVNELSTIYAEPAKRFVSGDENNRRYQALLESIGMDERMFHVSCLLNLHRAMLVRFRVRELPDKTREPVLDWATPATVRAVLHPNDPSLVIGWLIRTSYRTARPGTETPAWTLWTDYERVQLRDDMAPIADTYLEHKLERNPWVGVCLSPVGPGFWPGDEGEDLVAATVSTWLANVLLMKETKSATKAETITGDGTAMMRGQPSDSELPRQIADGQSVTVTDMSMDLSLFRDTADHIIEHVAQNYGMSAALINQEGVQSAQARELMRIPLHQLRLRQQTPLRRFERALVGVMVAVIAKDMSDVSFTADGWGVTFGESHTPLSRDEEITLFIKERQATVDSTIAFIMRRDRCTREQAVDRLRDFVDDEEVRNEMLRPLAAASGSPGKETPDVTKPAPIAPADQA
jgi:hypothetical protein